MASTGCWLDQGGFDVTDVLDFENLALRVRDVLGESTTESGPMAFPLCERRLQRKEGDKVSRRTRDGAAGETQ